MTSGTKVVAVKTVSSGVEMWSTDSFLPGDILDQLKAPRVPTFVATGGRSGLKKELRNFVNVPGLVATIKRAGMELEIPAKVVVVVATLLKKQQYLLAGHQNPGHLCTLSDLAVDECASLQETTLLSMMTARTLRSDMQRERLLSQLRNTKLTDSYAAYPWNRKLHAFSRVPGSKIPFSLLLMPHQPNRLTSDYWDVEETLARAMAWFTAAQLLGVPIAFVNIQTEPFLLQGPGFMATGLSRQDPEATANAGVYTVQGYDGLDIEVVRAVRIWYEPVAGEQVVDLLARNGETGLGVAIRGTEEGFCHISSVEAGTAADRAGLTPLYQAARTARKLLVISKVGGVNVTPWMVNFSGAVRLFHPDTIFEKLRLHVQAGQSVRLHVMLWEGARHGPVTHIGNLPVVTTVGEPRNSADYFDLRTEALNFDRVG